MDSVTGTYSREIPPQVHKETYLQMLILELFVYWETEGKLGVPSWESRDEKSVVDTHCGIPY